MEAGRGYKETWQMGQMGFMAVGMIASAAAGLMTPVEGMLSVELAMKIVAVIYAVFGAQMFLVCRDSSWPRISRAGRIRASACSCMSTPGYFSSSASTALLSDMLSHLTSRF